jgi:hypothetical protein
MLTVIGCLSEIFQEIASDMKRLRGGDIVKVDRVNCGAE